MDNNNMYNNNYNQQNDTFNGMNTVPEQAKGFAIASMILGICAICFCWCYGIVGLACGIVGLVLAFSYKKKNGFLKGMATAGFVCSIIGIALSVVVIIYFICVFAFVGSALGGTFSALTRH